jgi:hypothetical protein
MVASLCGFLLEPLLAGEGMFLRVGAEGDVALFVVALLVEGADRFCLFGLEFLEDLEAC